MMLMLAHCSLLPYHLVNGVEERTKVREVGWVCCYSRSFCIASCFSFPSTKIT